MEGPTVEVLDALRGRADHGALTRRSGQAVWDIASRAALRRRRLRAAVLATVAVCAGVGGVGVVRASGHGAHRSVSVLGEGGAGPAPTAPSVAASTVTTGHLVRRASGHTIVYLSGPSLMEPTSGLTQVGEVDTDSNGQPAVLPVDPPASAGVGAGSGLPAVVVSPALDHSHSRIAFVFGPADSLRRSGEGSIASENPDGTGAQALTQGPGDGNPAWSWDGTETAFLA